MSHYCGIDLHSNNHVVVVIDEKDKRVFDKRLNNFIEKTKENKLIKGFGGIDKYYRK